MDEKITELAGYHVRIRRRARMRNQGVVCSLFHQKNVNGRARSQSLAYRVFAFYIHQINSSPFS